MSEDKKFRIINLEELEEMTDEELIKYGIESINAMMDFKLEYKEVDAIISNMTEVTLEDEIVKEAFNFTKADKGIFQAPYYNEEDKQPRLKGTYFGAGIIHERGYKIKIEPKKNVLPFGFVQLITKKYEIGRKTNDVHYEDLKVGRDVDEKLFVHDYDFEETLKKHKEESSSNNGDGEEEKVYPFVEKPNKKPKDKDKQEKFKEKKEMYEQRKALLDAATIRWMDFSARYVDSHELIFDELYGLLKEIKNTPTLINYSVFFDVCIMKIKELKKKIGVKVCLSHTDMETYEFLIKKMDEYIIDLKDLVVEVKDLMLSDEEFNNLGEDKGTRVKFGKNENFRDITTMHAKANEVFTKMEAEVDSYMRFFIPYHEPGDNEYDPNLRKKYNDGFIIDDSSEDIKEWRIYLTPFSIEKFRQHTIRNMTLDELNSIPEKVLDKYKELKSR